MFGISKRKNLSGMTVGELIHELTQLPSDAQFCCCGDNCAYLHVEKDDSAICIDVEDLDDLYADYPDVTPEEFWANCDNSEELNLVDNSN